MQTQAAQLPDAPLATAPAAVSAQVAVSSHVLGELSVPSEAVYTFEAGVYAFEACRRFALVPTEHRALYWLQSLEEHALTFLVADPFQFFPGYEVELSEADQAAVGDPGAGDALVLAIVTLPGDPAGTATANLRAPLVLNAARRLGRQTMLLRDDLQVAEPIVIG